MNRRAFFAAMSTVFVPKPGPKAPPRPRLSSDELDAYVAARLHARRTVQAARGLHRRLPPSFAFDDLIGSALLETSCAPMTHAAQPIESTNHNRLSIYLSFRFPALGGLPIGKLPAGIHQFACLHPGQNAGLPAIRLTHS